MNTMVDSRINIVYFSNLKTTVIILDQHSTCKCKEKKEEF